MSFKTDFRTLYPGVYFLDAGDLPALNAYLAEGERLRPGEVLLAAEKAGEGNMNCTVRVRTTAGSFILKQSRPWLEKYPHISAPFDRALVEARFYQLVSSNEAVASRMPRLLWADERARTLALEDLGTASDYFPLYARRITLSDTDLSALVDYLAVLHRLAPARVEDREGFTNHAMRVLNHEHMFALPLREQNGLDLDAYTGTLGLAAFAASLKADAAYKQALIALGERYLHGEGESLLHGDFFPGSFLQTGAGVRIIDPEFCFCGDAELDLGVLAAHLLLAGEPAARAEGILALYGSAGGDFLPALARQYAGVEMMRRLIGVAQVPTLGADLARKTDLLAFSRQLVLTPERKFAF